MNLSLSLDLFSDAAPEPTVQQLQEASAVLQAATERSRALREDLAFAETEVEPKPDVKSVAFYSTKLCNPHAYAFAAQARHHGADDPALAFTVDALGVRHYDLRELSRYANELLRGVRSDRPALTPERWGEAIAAVRGGKL